MFDANAVVVKFNVKTMVNDTNILMKVILFFVFCIHKVAPFFLIFHFLDT